MAKKSKYYIGIDAGLQGGIAVTNNDKVLFTCAMPLDGKILDSVALFSTIRKIRNLIKRKKGQCLAITEQLHGLPNQKLSVIWSLSGQVHIIEFILKLLKIPSPLRTPGTWQKEMFKGTKVIRKKVKDKWKNDTKKMAATSAKKIFPSEKFLKNDKCIKKIICNIFHYCNKNVNF